jgi:hypothetical protein
MGALRLKVQRAGKTLSATPMHPVEQRKKTMRLQSLSIHVRR